MRSFYFVVKMEYFLPLSPNVCLAVLFGYYPAQPFVAERGKSTILTTKRCCENSVFPAEHGKYNFLTTKNVIKIANG